jgi:hypothetical protein
MSGNSFVPQRFEQEARIKMEEQAQKNGSQMKYDSKAALMLRKETALAILFLVIVIGAILLLHFN